MPSQKNQTTVQDLQAKIKLAKSIVLADYRGLTVNQQQNLRRQVKAVNGELIVAKNTLLKVAVKNLDLPLETVEAFFTGPTITLLAYEDEIAPIKALAEFAKNHQLPQVKCGFLNKEPLTKDQVEQLSSLPTKIELLAKTIGTIKAPLYGFVNVLFGNIRQLVFALEAIRQQKGGE